ncbi:SET domain-containing protein [Coccomyxa subellipsoidea C-169]|uniref:SET domain-containing protein n=1 Tax=Coccomyxa subellipsoidea (strain C-169) TaxID=574566 RepID=I0YZM1_COCSC|nr:SET domain-containing protein [Coccomyxa subellipsoidea C-169]EIE23840.1 SET domain-containing protein [Coccomyxa subellipsoidea C-169]|eukprot:XP_005648384.1 SET domain-containing protein [Coccomyxa subellipsoidea C-169]
MLMSTDKSLRCSSMIVRTHCFLLLFVPACLPSTEQIEVLDWVDSKGGYAHLSVGTVNDAGLRGTLATRDIAEGETLAYIPRELIVEFGAPAHDKPPENAARLLARQRRDPAWHAAFLPYWRSLPAPASRAIFCKEMFTQRHRDLLQDAEMAAVVVEETGVARQVYNGSSSWWQRWLGQAPPVSLQGLLPEGAAHKISWQEFAHTTCHVGAYGFGCRGAWGGRRVCLVPLLDLMNHAAPDLANVIVHQDEGNGSYGCTATRAIRAGEEVTQTYSAAALRSDYSLLHYGFVLDSERPLLAGLDHMARFEHDNDDLYLQHQSLMSHEEAQRLSGILASFPTTEAEDLQLLQGTGAIFVPPEDLRLRRVSEVVPVNRELVGI